jgi:hypothetical protein
LLAKIEKKKYTTQHNQEVGHIVAAQKHEPPIRSLFQAYTDAHGWVLDLWTYAQKVTLYSIQDQTMAMTMLWWYQCRKMTLRPLSTRMAVSKSS